MILLKVEYTLHISLYALKDSFSLSEKCYSESTGAMFPKCSTEKLTDIEKQMLTHTKLETLN